MMRTAQDARPQRTRLVVVRARLSRMNKKIRLKNIATRIAKHIHQPRGDATPFQSIYNMKYTP
jgi:hypothetical protein